MRAAAIIVALALGFTVGCKKSEEKAPAKDQGPPPMPAAEQERGRAACTAWVEHLCACAKTKPELQPECDLRSARPAALQAALDVLRSDAEPRVKYKAQKNARKMIKGCIEQDNKLRATCPR